MNFSWALLALIAIIPADENTGLVCDECEIVEVNHYFDDQGRHVFDQLIFYSASETGFEVRTWRLLKSESQEPTSGYVTWHDGDVLRQVRYKRRHESWTQHDVEITARSSLPKEQRRPLTNIRYHTTSPEAADLEIP